MRIWDETILEMEAAFLACLAYRRHLEALRLACHLEDDPDPNE